MKMVCAEVGCGVTMSDEASGAIVDDSEGFNVNIRGVVGDIVIVIGVGVLVVWDVVLLVGVFAVVSLGSTVVGDSVICTAVVGLSDIGSVVYGSVVRFAVDSDLFVGVAVNGTLVECSAIFGAAVGCDLEIILALDGSSVRV